MSRYAWILALSLAAPLGAAADSIAFDGKTYDDVFIAEGEAMYYIHIPDTGEVLSVRKENVPAGALRLTRDSEARQALRERWNASRDRVRLLEKAPEAASPLTVAGLSAAVGAAAPAPQQERVTDGTVPQVRLRNLPLRQGLKALLRPMDLDYKVEDGYLWVSTPRRIRTESAEALTTRHYDLRGSAADTLPKVVMTNPGGGGVGGGFGGNQFGGGGFGGNQFGGGGFGGNQFGGGGLGGNQFGGGGFGGGGMGGGATFTNISQLFSTIDDRLVGEPPAVIGLQPGTMVPMNANYYAHHGITGR